MGEVSQSPVHLYTLESEDMAAREISSPMRPSAMWIVVEDGQKPKTKPDRRRDADTSLSRVLYQPYPDQEEIRGIFHKRGQRGIVKS